MTDFEALRKQRNDAIRKMIEDETLRNGWDPKTVTHNFDFNSCYCACVEGGPCEHDFKGWKDLHNSNGEVCGGERVCARCGMGAMAHSLRFM